MSDTNDPVDILTESECWERVRVQELGRLVTRVQDVMDIFPVNYVVDGDSILFRTAAGSKLFELTVNDEVLFEVDDHTDTDAWSVVIRGHAETLDTSEDVERADGLGLRPWVPTLKYTWVRVVAQAVTGRAFAFAPEPDRYGIQQY